MIFTTRKNKLLNLPNLRFLRAVKKPPDFCPFVRIKTQYTKTLGPIKDSKLYLYTPYALNLGVPVIMHCLAYFMIKSTARANKKC